MFRRDSSFFVSLLSPLPPLSASRTERLSSDESCFFSSASSSCLIPSLCASSSFLFPSTSRRGEAEEKCKNSGASTKKRELFLSFIGLSASPLLSFPCFFAGACWPSSSLFISHLHSNAASVKSSIVSCLDVFCSYAAALAVFCWLWFVSSFLSSADLGGVDVRKKNVLSSFVSTLFFSLESFPATVARQGEEPRGISFFGSPFREPRASAGKRKELGADEDNVGCCLSFFSSALCPSDCRHTLLLSFSSVRLSPSARLLVSFSSFHTCSPVSGDSRGEISSSRFLRTSTKAQRMCPFCTGPVSKETGASLQQFVTRSDDDEHALS